MQLEKRLQGLEDQIKVNATIMQKLEAGEAQHSTSVIETIQSKLQEDGSERDEQLKRKNNVIVFGLEESSSNDASVRIVDDLDKIQSVASQLQMQHDCDITKVVRLGKKQEGEDVNPRPMLVTFQSEEAKIDLLKKAKNLRSMKEGGLNKIFIAPDMTPKQREARKKLVAELKDRQSQGETGLIIVGSRIVKKMFSQNV